MDKLKHNWDSDMATYTGTVKFFNITKGFGFIKPDDGGDDVFVHITAVETAGLTTLSQGQRVTFDIETGKNGKKSAVNIQELRSLMINPTYIEPCTAVRIARCEHFIIKV